MAEAKALPIVKYDIAKTEIAKMKTEFMQLIITGVEDKEGYKIVHRSRMVVKNQRIAVENRRKELKARILAYGKEVDDKAKEYFSLLAPIE